MNRFAKKVFLIYCLFLLTTLTNNPGFATDLTTMENGHNSGFVQTEVDEKPPQPALPGSKKPDVATISTPAVAAEKSLGTPAEPETALTGIIPTKIEIPSISEQAEVIEVGVTDEGAMEAPSTIYQIGWFALGTMPGAIGNAVMAGHVDGETSPGTFYNLKELESGDEVHVTGTNGKRLTFIVTEKESYGPEEAPLEKIFGGNSKAALNLITCTGNFNRSTGRYEERLVIYTELSSNS